MSNIFFQCFTVLILGMFIKNSYKEQTTLYWTDDGSGQTVLNTYKAVLQGPRFIAGTEESKDEPGQSEVM